MDEYQHLAVQT